jgi:hypothetical protein
MMRNQIFGCAVLTAVFGAGCLSNTYTLREGELHRLAATPPEKRGEKVEVVQRVGADEEPSAQPVESHTTVVVVGVLPVPGPEPVHRHQGHSSAPAGPGPSPHASAAKSDAVAAAAVVGIGTTIALAATEGARYDGWVQVHPMHPLHLQLRDGSQAWVPLAYLDERTIADTDEAYLNRAEGPWTPLGRAPLNRVGGTFGFAMGAAALNSAASSTVWGVLARLELGGFFTKQIGLLATLGLGTGVGGTGKTTFNARYGGELRYYPLRFDVLELGGYATAGFAQSSADMPTYEWSKDGFFYGGGGLVEIELSTRLALALRGGVAVLPNDRAVVAPEITIGLSVY